MNRKCKIFCGLSILSLVYISRLMPVPYYLDFCHFLVGIEIKKCANSNSVVCKIVLAILSPLQFHKNFSISFSISKNYTVGILIGIMLNP